jgi:hypothetical protein
MQIYLCQIRELTKATTGFNYELNARQCIEQEEYNNTVVTENKQLQQYNNKCRGRNRLKKSNNNNNRAA